MSLTKLSNPVAATPFNVFCAASNRGKPKQNIGNESGRKLNAAQTAIAINAANGNTIIYDKHFTIADDGISISAGMLWNSTEKKWRFAAGAATLQP